MKTKIMRVLAGLAALMAAGITSQTQYAFTDLQYPGVPLGSTYANGIDGANIVGGYWDANNGGHGFLYNVTNWITLDAPGASTNSGEGTWAGGLSGANVVGGYTDNSGVNHGFLYSLASETWTNLDDPLAASGSGQGTLGSAIAGTTIVGNYYDSNGAFHGFLYTGTNWITLDAPGAGTASGQGTQLTGISGATIAGSYYDSSGSFHGVLYSMITSNWTKLNDDPQGLNQTYVDGISGSNISGSYFEGTNAYGFIYNMITSNWTKVFDPLAGIGQYPNGGCFGHGITGDTFVGSYYNTNGINGYVATPIPRLALTVSTNGAKIAWPYSPFITWTLQQSPDLSHWVTNSAPVTNDGTNNALTITPSPSGDMFFRLVQ